VAEATTVAREMSDPTPMMSDGRRAALTPVSEWRSVAECNGWNSWVDRMEALTTRYVAVIETANAESFPSPTEYQHRANDLGDIAREIRNMVRPPAAEGFVEIQSSYLLSMSYAFHAAAVEQDMGLYLDSADREYRDSERLRVKANLACAGQ